MNCTRPCASLLALILFSTVLPAQETKPSNIDSSTGGASSTTRPKKERVISSDLSKSLSSGIKYNPPPPPKPEVEDVDMRDVDKPRNQIIRLPKYVVEAKRPPVFNDRNLYSQEMLRRLAYKQYTSAFSRNLLNRYHIFGQGDIDYAMMQYEAAERQRNIAEMDDKVSMYRVSGDNAEAATLKDDTQRSFMRRTDYITTPGSAKTN